MNNIQDETPIGCNYFHKSEEDQNIKIKFGAIKKWTDSNKTSVELSDGQIISINKIENFYYKEIGKVKNDKCKYKIFNNYENK
jgi:hypothetical protein